MRPCPPDILFTEQNLRLLRPGGRLAIVLPYQLLSGPQCVWFRKWLIEQTEIRAVVDLPADTFQPYTGTKTSLVLLQRPRNDGRPRSHNIFMACPRWIGHDRRGNPMYRYAPDGSETDTVLTDFPEVEQTYEEFRQGNSQLEITNPQTFVIKSDELLRTYNFRIDARFHKIGLSTKKSTVQLGCRSEKTERLKNLVERIFYPGRFKRRYVERSPGAIPFLGGTNISQLLVKTDKWLAPDNPHLDQLRVQKGWLLVTRSGSTGIVSSVPAAWDGFAISEHVIRIVPSTDAVVPGEYLLAYLRSEQAQRTIHRGIFGSVIDEISPDYLGDLPVPIPKAKELEKIVKAVQTAEKSRQKAIRQFESATASVPFF